VKHILVGMVLATCAVSPALSDDQRGTLVDRQSVWTVAALGDHPPPAPTVDHYQLEWQQQLLAFQLAYSKVLADRPDMIETGSVTATE